MKFEHYRQSLGMLRDRLGDHRLVDELEFELEMLDGLPPRGLQRGMARVNVRWARRS